MVYAFFENRQGANWNTVWIDGSVDQPHTANFILVESVYHFILFDTFVDMKGYSLTDF